MSLLSRLFGGGGGAAPKAEPVDHKGYLIFAEPMNEGGKFRLAARIEKEIGGEVKTHHLVRADVLDSREVACDLAINKAKQVIDFEGDTIFR